ncbi:SseB family protein [Chitinophagaceae bacterium LB-8]|uniref:SseB family protein n=1 Tax=Paraflavisolibacter caeni TaxID=2982496 RepID=A0A9X2XP17_9BACT|nr:SseB family protein [Paraflavisolibacter caeni]MCU7549674.1 SseB family protein [Paraflavisolibacter caeni]
MNFLKKLFGAYEQDQPVELETKPDNSRLNYLLDMNGRQRSDENYKAILQEISRGNSYLLLPSVNETHGTSKWKTLKKGSTLTLTSVFNLDGLQVLGAFSDEKSLYKWAKKETAYTAMKSQDLLAFCQQHDIDRIVINSDQKNMFVLERNRSNIETRTIKQDTTLLFGKPAKPLNGHILKNLINNFQKVDTILEAYQYAQSLNDETSIVIGIRMSTVTENSRAALHNALNKALANEQLEIALDIMIIQTEERLQTIRNIQDSLFYRR